MVKKQNVRVIAMDMQAVQRECFDIAQKIHGGGYIPDLVVFIAKSGFMFAEPIAKYFNCDIAAVTVKRPGNDHKDMIRRYIKYIPQWLLFAVLKSKFMYSYNDTHEEREVSVNTRFLEMSKQAKYQNILLVDDSTDTGLSLIKAKEVLEKYFPDSEIRTFCYCVISLSEKRVKADYLKYRDTIVVTATSRYSKEHDAFLNAYNEWNRLQAEAAS